MTPSSSTIAVVIPCYRQAHYLHEAIESVLAQTRPANEIIVVDDGSPDDTQRVVELYARSAPQVRCIRQANQGLSAARNAGLRMASADFIMFLDADDRLHDSALALSAAALEQNPTWAFVFGEHRLIDTSGVLLRDKRGSCCEGDLYEAMLRTNIVGVPAAVLYRREIMLRAGGFDESYRAAEDYELYLRIMRTDPVGCHSHLIADYRRHPGAMSNDAALLFEFTQRALEEQAGWTMNNAKYERARRDGLRAWRSRYGTAQAVVLLRRAFAGDWRPALHSSTIVLKYAPVALWTRLRRHLRLRDGTKR